MRDNGLSVSATDRRAFVRRAGIVALGLPTVALADPTKARAAGNRLSASQYAFTDGPNTFTADQTIDASLRVVRDDPGFACSIEGYTHALGVRQSRDLAGAAEDTMNVFHTGTGDGVYIDHKGGKPPGYNGPVGGNSGLNVLIPYYLDAGGTGREGTIVNNRTGMCGLFVQTQATTDGVSALVAYHSGNGPTAHFVVQPPTYPQGAGGGIVIDDYSAGSSLSVGKWTAPQTGSAILALSGGVDSPIQALRVTEKGGTVRATISTDGTAAFGTGNPFAVRLQSEMKSTGVARSLALSNSSDTDGSGAQIEFDSQSSQQALITAIFDKIGPSRDSSLKFSVRAGDVMTERLKLNAAGIGFFGATPVSRPVVSGSRKGNLALENLLTSLANLGLIRDSSTS